jgi:Asp-tRNA(Asn)/Glu-tRNA(Gln) amidotransferase C subunit
MHINNKLIKELAKQAKLDIKESQLENYQKFLKDLVKLAAPLQKIKYNVADRTYA